LGLGLHSLKDEVFLLLIVRFGSYPFALEIQRHLLGLRSFQNDLGIDKLDKTISLVPPLLLLDM
jgi:hypothetical protein